MIVAVSSMYLPLDAGVLHDTADVVGGLQAALAGPYHLGVGVVVGEWR